MIETNHLKSWRRIFLAPILAGTTSLTACGSGAVDRREPIQVTLTEEEEEAWDATAAFVAGVFTIANADSLDSTLFFENFRANYDWIKDIFLPHLLGTAEHLWWECDEYCVKTAKLLAKGDKKRERELMESLARHKLHERQRPKSHEH
jgi:hypothetical protein